MSGGADDDRISARDGARDRIDCGSGRDTVTADPVQIGIDAQVLPGGKLVKVVFDVWDVAEARLDRAEVAGEVVSQDGDVTLFGRRKDGSVLRMGPFALGTGLAVGA